MLSTMEHSPSVWTGLQRERPSRVPRRSSGPRDARLVLDSDEPMTLGELAGPPTCPRARPRAWSRRSSGTRWCTRPARGSSSPARRSCASRSAADGAPPRRAGRARARGRSRGQRRDDQPRRARPEWRQPPRPGRLAPHDRRRPMGRPRVAYHCTANGKVFLAFGAAELPPSRWRASRRTRSSTAPHSSGLERVRATATPPPSTRSRSASARWPRPSAGRPARSSPRSASRARRCA